MEGILQTEEKEFENELNLLLSYDKECNKIVESYQSYFSSKDKNTNKEKQFKIDKSFKSLENKIQTSLTTQNKSNNVEILIKHKNITQKFVSREQLPQGGQAIEKQEEKEKYVNYSTDDWKLSVCGIPGRIKNNGKTFDSVDYRHNSETCAARTDVAMIDNSGVHEIYWKIERLHGADNVIGLCTNLYKAGNPPSKNWIKTFGYVGWCNLNDDQRCKNRILCGLHNQKQNKFYKSCEFVGEALPQYGAKDIIGLIYDSYKHTLKFSKNGKILASELTKIPSGIGLYWFVAKSQRGMKFTIIPARKGNTRQVKQRNLAYQAPVPSAPSAPGQASFNQNKYLPDDYLDNRNKSNNQQASYTFQ